MRFKCTVNGTDIFYSLSMMAFFFNFYLLIFIGVQLIYNVVLVSNVHQSESVICILITCMCVLSCV